MITVRDKLPSFRRMHSGVEPATPNGKDVKGEARESMWVV